jgi:hypothetical protein
MNEVRAYCQHDGCSRIWAGCDRDQQRDKSFDIVGMLLALVRVLGSRRHGIKILPLIDIDE